MSHFQRTANVSTLLQSVGNTISHDLIGGNTRPTSLFMHGILGTKKNWRTPSNVWQKMCPQYSCLTVDHRGHGDSHFIKSDKNDLKSCVGDLVKLLHDQNIPYPEIIFAHSFSGKVALQYLSELQSTNATSSLRESAFPKHTWILDTIPIKNHRNGNQANAISSVFDVLDILTSLPKSFESKDWIMKELSLRGIEKPVVQWIAMNVVPDKKDPGALIDHQSFTWNFNLDTIMELFQSYCETDMWKFLQEYNGPGMIHFVRAGKNSAWTSQLLKDFDDLQEQNHKIRLHTMPHVGHWLHTEDLHGLLRLILKESKIESSTMFTSP